MEDNPFAKYAQQEDNPFAKYATQDAPAIEKASTPVASAPAQSKQALLQQYLSPPANLGQEIDNLRGGMVRGAGSIGASLLAPIDALKDAISGKGFGLASNNQRRTDMDAALASLGADTGSRGYGTGKLAAEIAGTAGLGGGLAKGMQAIPALAKYAPLVQSGGMTLGPANTGSYLANGALRVGGGAALGGVTAAMIDPKDTGSGMLAGAALPVGVKAAQYTGQAIRSGVKNALGASTGTSAETMSAAYNAGKNRQDAFLKNMRGEAGFDDVVQSAKDGLSNMRSARAADYRSGMVDISADKAVLDFAPIEQALSNVQSTGSFKGVAINKNASGIVDELSGEIARWKALDPKEYHTPEGLDALKKSIGDIRDATQFGTPARRAADAVYNGVKGEITKQAPTYSKVMGDYSRASDELEEITKALSLGDKTSKDTAVRKLQSLMRNNAQTSYGNRLSLAQQLEQKGGVELTPAIAGQAMNSIMPRGMSGAIQKAGGAALAGAGFFNPALLAPLAFAPLASPRLMGEAAYKAGLLSSKAGAAGKAASTGLLGAPSGAAGGLLGSGLFTTLPIAISASQTARQ